MIFLVLRASFLCTCVLKICHYFVRGPPALCQQGGRRTSRTGGARFLGRVQARRGPHAPLPGPGIRGRGLRRRVPRDTWSYVSVAVTTVAGGRDAAKHPAVHRRPHHRPCPDPRCREAEPSRFGGDSGRGPRPRDTRAPGAGRPRGACPAHMEQTSLMKLLLLKALTHAPRGPTDPGGGCDLHGQGGRAGGGGGWVGR